jgi:hypothetical protein
MITSFSCGNSTTRFAKRVPDPSNPGNSTNVIAFKFSTSSSARYYTPVETETLARPSQKKKTPRYFRGVFQFR